MEPTERIRDLEEKMKAVKITETEIADAAGMYQPLVSNVLRGRRRISVERMDALHAAFTEVAKKKVERLEQVLAEPKIRRL